MAITYRSLPVRPFLFSVSTNNSVQLRKFSVGMHAIANDFSARIVHLSKYKFNLMALYFSTITVYCTVFHRSPRSLYIIGCCMSTKTYTTTTIIPTNNFTNAPQISFLHYYKIYHSEHFFIRHPVHTKSIKYPYLHVSL